MCTCSQEVPHQSACWTSEDRVEFAPHFSDRWDKLEQEKLRNCKNTIIKSQSLSPIVAISTSESEQNLNDSEPGHLLQLFLLVTKTLQPQ